MARSKPTHRVVRADGETGARSTVGRHVTAEAAQEARLGKRAELEMGSSDSFGVQAIRRRDEKGGR
ncbi:hypothetical protein ACU61A_15590 [Pseudonocardia sichuanensis]